MIAADAPERQRRTAEIKAVGQPQVPARVSTVLKQVEITPADIERSILWAVGERASQRAGAAGDRSAANG